MSKGAFDDEREVWPVVLAYWRSFPAEAFDDGLQDEIISCVRNITSTMADWKAAIEGDAAAACGLALKMPVPERISARVDLLMTVLLNCAFVNPAAAFVLANRLDQMPLPRRRRARLSTSWKVHNIYLARRSYGRRSIPSALFRRED